MKKKYEQTRFDKQAQNRIKYVIEHWFNGSQQALSDKCGVHKASISQYVNGKNTPSNLTAEKICKPLGLNPAWLMGFDVPMYNILKHEGEMGQMAEKESALIAEIEVKARQMDIDSLQKYASYGEYLIFKQSEENPK